MGNRQTPGGQQGRAGVQRGFDHANEQAGSWRKRSDQGGAPGAQGAPARGAQPQGRQGGRQQHHGQSGPPAPSQPRFLDFAARLRQAKARLRHVEPGGSAAADLRGAPRGRARSSRSAQQAGSVSAHWELSDRASGLDGDEEGAPVDLRSLHVRLEASVPVGCQVTVDLNGEPSVLRPGDQPRGVPFKTKKKKKQVVQATAVHERSFGLAPLGSTQSISDQGARDEMGDDAPERAPADVQSDRNTVAKRSELATPASLEARVMLDSELTTRTAQELLMPQIEIMEIMDTCVVLRLSQMTGDRFELTVYASVDSGESCSAATLVQEGPVRNHEQVHRVEQLECSQVYVAWVKVFSEGQAQTMESQQKGFKTLPPKEITIWDLPDHEILGLDKMATSKEIIKAWRKQSLRFHPDKETDPEKKEDAEDMMKRLNIAKQIMLRSCPLGDNNPETPTSPNDENPAGPGDPSPFGAAAADQPDYWSDSVGPDFDDDEDGMNFMKPGDVPDGFAAPDADGGAAAAAAAEDAERDRLRCLLRVEAPRPPRLQVIQRLLTTLVVEATHVPLGCTVEVQTFDEAQGEWQGACEPVKASSDTMQFTLNDLEENRSYRLRLRTILDVLPILLTFAEFTDSGVDEQAQHVFEEEGEGDEVEEEDEEYDQDDEEEFEGSQGAQQGDWNQWGDYGHGGRHQQDEAFAGSGEEIPEGGGAPGSFHGSAGPADLGAFQNGAECWSL